MPKLIRINASPRIEERKWKELIIRIIACITTGISVNQLPSALSGGICFSTTTQTLIK